MGVDAVKYLARRAKEASTWASVAAVGVLVYHHVPIGWPSWVTIVATAFAAIFGVLIPEPHKPQYEVAGLVMR